jgi:hypothetical protein
MSEDQVGDPLPSALRTAIAPAPSAYLYAAPVAGVNSTVTSTPEKIYALNDPVANGTTQITVYANTYRDTVERYKHVDYGDSGYVAVAAIHPAKYVLVETTLENIGKMRFDIENTVEAALVDTVQSIQLLRS